jgi:tryptophan synthase alpha chain
MENIKRTYQQIKNNKMLIGFGISSAQNILDFSPYCDGVIVGSAFVKAITKDVETNSGYNNALNLIQLLSAACDKSV